MCALRAGARPTAFGVAPLAFRVALRGPMCCRPAHRQIDGPDDGRCFSVARQCDDGHRRPSR
eukprot:14226989-Alexandrium_andersonii.AAC.1